MGVRGRVCTVSTACLLEGGCRSPMKLSCFSASYLERLVALALRGRKGEFAALGLLARGILRFDIMPLRSSSGEIDAAAAAAAAAMRDDPTVTHETSVSVEGQVPVTAGGRTRRLTRHGVEKDVL